MKKLIVFLIVALLSVGMTVSAYAQSEQPEADIGSKSNPNASTGVFGGENVDDVLQGEADVADVPAGGSDEIPAGDTDINAGADVPAGGSDEIPAGDTDIDTGADIPAGGSDEIPAGDTDINAGANVPAGGSDEIPGADTPAGGAGEPEADVGSQGNPNANTNTNGDGENVDDVLQGGADVIPVNGNNSWLWLWTVCGVFLLGTVAILYANRTRLIPAFQTNSGNVVTGNAPVSTKQTITAIKSSALTPSDDVFKNIMEKVNKTKSNTKQG